MADIIIPVEATNLKSILPAGDEIIYSTLANVSIHERKLIHYWKSHLLATPNGFAITIPGANNKLNGKYFPWYNVEKIDRTKFKLHRKKKIMIRWLFYVEEYRWSIWYDVNSESEDQFLPRAEGFGALVIPIIIQRKQEWLDANNASSTPDKKKRKIVENGLKIALKFQKEI